MNAFRIFAEVKKREVRFILPKSVKSQKVEIIIIPVESDSEAATDESIAETFVTEASELLTKQKNESATEKSTVNDLQRLLLEAPDLTDKEFNHIIEKRKSLNQWR